MSEQRIEVIVYGTEVICASCVGMPSSVETYEWLKAALGRKYDEAAYTVTYVDFNVPQADEGKQQFAERVVEEDLFYPVVVINDEIVGEGNPKLKHIYAALEELGVTPLS